MLAVNINKKKRKGVRRGEEEGMSRGVESQYSYKFHHLPRLGSSIISPCHNQSKDDMLSPIMCLDVYTPHKEGGTKEMDLDLDLD
jgi:hypothetical protein